MTIKQAEVKSSNRNPKIIAAVQSVATIEGFSPAAGGAAIGQIKKNALFF
jgi:hypothetical protein